MSLPAITLWADSGKTSFMSGWQVGTQLGSLSFRQGDTLGIELHWVKQVDGALMKEVIWPAAANITLAVGKISALPDSGNYQLAYGGVATGEIAYDALPATIQSLLNALPAIASEGGVTVVRNSITTRVVWNAPCIPSSTISLYENNLVPTSSVGINSARTGTTSIAQITQINIKQAPFAVCTQWTPQVGPTVLVVETHAPAYSGDFRIFRMLISPNPKGGTFRLEKTINNVDYYTQPMAIEGLNAGVIAGELGLSVTQIDEFEFEIFQPQVAGEVLVNVSAIEADGSGLIAYSAMYGDMSFNSLDVELALAGKASVACSVELEIEADGYRQTLVQGSAVVFNDLIDTDSYTLVEWGELIPADSVVRFDSPQSLLNNQKLQARTNIGSIGADLLVPFTAKDTELTGRITQLEGEVLSPSMRAALNGASLPSVTNPFATQDYVNSVVSSGHTHDISSVVNLQETLDEKAAILHGHSIADVAGLQAQIDLLQGANLTIDQKGAVEKSGNLSLDSISSSNPLVAVSDHPVLFDGRFAAIDPNASGVGTEVSDYYPIELQVTINGVAYCVPARLA